MDFLVAAVGVALLGVEAGRAELIDTPYAAATSAGDRSLSSANDARDFFCARSTSSAVVRVFGFSFLLNDSTNFFFFTFCSEFSGSTLSDILRFFGRSRIGSAFESDDFAPFDFNLRKSVSVYCASQLSEHTCFSPPSLFLAPVYLCAPSSVCACLLRPRLVLMTFLWAR